MSNPLQAHYSNGKLVVPKVHVGFMVSAFIVGALTLVTGLRWNAAFHAAIDDIERKYETRISPVTLSFVVALVVTIVVLFITIGLQNMLSRSTRLSLGHSHRKFKTTFGA